MSESQQKYQGVAQTDEEERSSVHLPPPPTEHSSVLDQKKFKILIVVTSYFVISMSMVFLNKMLLTENASIPAPLFVTWFQCVVTAAIIAGLGEMGKMFSNQKSLDSATTMADKDKSFFAQFPPFEYDINIAKRVMPLSLIFVAMISLNNLCLQYVEVTFYQVARGLTTVFNVALSFLILGERTSMQALICCALIISGFCVGVENEVRFTLLGTMFGVGSSLFVCLNAMYTKKINAVVDGNQWRLSLYNNINAMLLFPPLIVLFGEHTVILNHIAYLYSPIYWATMSLAGFFGFMIGIVTVFQITLTSPLTHNVAGTAKATLQTLLALVIYKNPVTWKGGVGIALILFGSGFYTAVRNWEMNKAKAQVGGR